MYDIINYGYWKWDGVLSKAFCDCALKEIDWSTAETAKIKGAEVDPEVRVSDVIWQYINSPLGCIANTYIQEANKAAGWGYNITAQQNTQITAYKSGNSGHYDWHKDTFPPENGIQRKLTCVILLNDSSEFEGGILQFKGMEDQILLEKRGSIIVFPSFIEHKVTPVTKGVRYTAVTWATGPSFR